MSAMPDDTKAKIREGALRALQSPTVRQRRSEGQKRAMTPARRAAIGKDRREFWRKWREARAAQDDAKPPS